MKLESARRGVVDCGVVSKRRVAALKRQAKPSRRYEILLRELFDCPTATAIACQFAGLHARLPCIECAKMKLESVTMLGFRCFDSAGETLALDDMTCLVGPNASGKTAALMALVRLFGE